MYITLAEAKKHLNLDDFFVDDDRYILSLIPVCEEAVSKRIDSPLSHMVDRATGELSPTLKHAILLLLGTYYSQREATSPQTIREVPHALDFLADLNRKYTVL